MGDTVSDGGAVAITAASPGEKSYELEIEGRTHGVFTYAFCQALRTNRQENSSVRLRSAFDEAYLAAKKRSRRRQHPLLFGTLDRTTRHTEKESAP